MPSALDALALAVADGAALRNALPGPFRRALRRHPRRGQLSGWRDLAPVPWSDHGHFHAADQDPGGNLDYHTGTAYPQDAASQLPVQLLAVQPGQTIIDLCAAPGSKSTQIGLALEDSGLLICSDRSAPRRRILSELLARQGVACALVTMMTPEQLAEYHPRCADGVLLDAPCSGHEERSIRQVARMAERQDALIETAATLVRPGGRLVYSTCTPYPAENEGVVLGFLRRHPEWTVISAAHPGCDADLSALGAVRLWPQRQRTEPFFACALRAPGDEPSPGLDGRLPGADATLRGYLPESPLHCSRRGDALVMATTAVAACRLPSETRGLLLQWRGQLLPWSAQALIERGAAHRVISREDAIRLWAGESLELPAGILIASDRGAPVGVMGSQGRLDQPSRQSRGGLC